MVLVVLSGSLVSLSPCPAQLVVEVRKLLQKSLVHLHSKHHQPKTTSTTRDKTKQPTNISEFDSAALLNANMESSDRLLPHNTRGGRANHKWQNVHVDADNQIIRVPGLG